MDLSLLDVDKNLANRIFRECNVRKKDLRTKSIISRIYHSKQVFLLKHSVTNLSNPKYTDAAIEIEIHLKECHLGGTQHLKTGRFNGINISNGSIMMSSTIIMAL